MIQQVKPQKAEPVDLSKLEKLPVTYQDLQNFLDKVKEFNLFLLRKETFPRVQRITGRPLICYVTKTYYNVQRGIPAYLDEGDLLGFTDLIRGIEGDAIDIVVESNGGSVETAERIIRLLREQFKEVRFIIPSNAYSAATLMCFSADQLVMDAISTLGPIDPQINGVPARAILRAFETLEARLRDEGPKALTAYMPLISKYDLHLFEICKSAQDLSEELAINWLSTYMLKCQRDDPKIMGIVSFFKNYDYHKSHGRSIGREKARELGLNIIDAEKIGLSELVRSLSNQYAFFFDKSTFYKVFENAYGVNWGRQMINIQVPITTQSPGTEPVPPGKSG